MAEKGYCVKCKASQEMKDEQKVTMKNGRAAMKGKCPACGTGMYKILGNKKS
jgi:Zn finger protein HypA/HybF involved in hydrogenase expression